MSATASKVVSYAGALRMALGDALAADPEVFIYGQDVGGCFGGAFKITKGLPEQFPERVINAPISEDAIAGVGIGAALDGARPVLEFQFADFSSVAFNQLVNHAGTSFWRTGRPCPLTVRLPVGGTPGGGPFHSQMPEAWFHHHPGLVVVAPATVADAYAMLRQSIEADDPVLFCEHKFLYERLRDETFDPNVEQPPLGEAVLRRHGADLTIVAWSAMLHDCLTAAQRLADEQGLEVEVVDLRCLRPLPLRLVLESLGRTGRLLVVSEDFPSGGVAAELLARVGEYGFGLLDAPPKRLTAKDTPIPFQPEVWAAHRPGVEAIMTAALELGRF